MNLWKHTYSWEMYDQFRWNIHIMESTAVIHELTYDCERGSSVISLKYPWKQCCSHIANTAELLQQAPQTSIQAEHAGHNSVSDFGTWVTTRSSCGYINVTHICDIVIYLADLYLNIISPVSLVKINC